MTAPKTQGEQPFYDGQPTPAPQPETQAASKVYTCNMKDNGEFSKPLGECNFDKVTISTTVSEGDEVLKQPKTKADEIDFSYLELLCKSYWPNETSTDSWESANTMKHLLKLGWRMPSQIIKIKSVYEAQHAKDEATIKRLRDALDSLLLSVDVFFPTIELAHGRDCRNPNLLTGLEENIKQAKAALEDVDKKGDTV